VSVGGVSGTATLVVNPAALVSIAIAPQAPTIALGDSEQFAAAGTYTDGTTQDVTGVVTWSTSLATVAIISNAVGSYGLATSAGLGTATITASSGTISSASSLTVSPPAISSIAVTPSSISISLGYTEQFRAVATYSDGSSQDITQSATWTSSVPSVAAVSSTGLATSMLVGTTTVSASAGSTTGSASLTVNAPVPVSLTIVPGSATIPSGSQLHLGATLFYSDGSSQNVTGTVSWSSSNSAVATVGNTGLVVSLAAGSSTIEATWGANLLTATANLTATSGQLTVSPASVNFGSVLVGSSQSQQITLSASGGSVTIPSAPAVTAPFSVSGITFPVSIPVGQSASFLLTFNPQAFGNASENISFVSSASNSPSVQSVAGMGANPMSHGMFILNPPSSDSNCNSPYPASCFSQHLVPTFICTGNGTPAGYNCAQAGAGEPYVKGAVFQVSWGVLNPGNGTYNFSSSDSQMTPWTAAGKLVSFVFEPTSFGTSNNVTPGWYLNPVRISSASQTSGIIEVQTSTAMGFFPGGISAAAGLEIQIKGTGTALDGNGTAASPGIWVVCNHSTAGCQDPTSETIYAIGSGANVAKVTGVGTVGNPVYGSSNGSTCTSGIIPIEWRPNFIRAWQNFIAQAVAHYGTNASVAYMRFGMGVGGQSNPTDGDSAPASNETPCQAQMTEFGFTSLAAPWPNPGTSEWSEVSANWINYLDAMLQFEQTLDSTKPLIVTLSPIVYSPNDLNTPDVTAADAAMAGIGIGSQGLRRSDPVNYAAGDPCYGGDWCANVSKYKGQVSTELQTLSDSDPTNVSQTGSLSDLLPFATSQGVGILELYFDDWMCTYDSTWSGDNTYAACNSAGYPAAVSAAAGEIN